MFSKPLALLHGELSKETLDQIVAKHRDAVCVLEGRPDLTASQRLILNLNKRGITPMVIADNMPGFLFARKSVSAVYVPGFEESTQKVLAPIGTLILAVLAKTHKVPVIISKSESKVRSMAKPESICSFRGTRIAPRGIKGYVPLVEWVDKKYITKS